MGYLDISLIMGAIGFILLFAFPFFRFKVFKEEFEGSFFTEMLIDGIDHMIEYINDTLPPENEGFLNLIGASVVFCVGVFLYSVICGFVGFIAALLWPLFLAAALVSLFIYIRFLIRNKKKED